MIPGYCKTASSGSKIHGVHDNKINGPIKTGDTFPMLESFVSYRQNTLIMKTSIIITALALAITLTSSLKAADLQNWDVDQKALWKTINEQVDLDFKQEWEEMKSYLHPDGIHWGADMPHPQNSNSYVHYTIIRDSEDKIKSHHLDPITITIVRDTAIVNCVGYLLRVDKDEKPYQEIFRLHNTWVKENGKWLLLATYNTLE